MHMQLANSCLLPALTVQPLAIYSHILYKLKQSIVPSDNMPFLFFRHITVKLFIFNAVSVVNIPEPTELFS